MMARPIILLAAVMVISPVHATGCATSTDCSLLGDCVAGSCRCDPGWRGADCSELALGPVASKADALLFDPAGRPTHRFNGATAERCAGLPGFSTARYKSRFPLGHDYSVTVVRPILSGAVESPHMRLKADDVPSGGVTWSGPRMDVG
jgi:hypothetical protein